MLFALDDCADYIRGDSCCRLRAGDTFSGICKANSMEQIRNANFSASLRDSSKNSKNSLKKPKVSSPSGREPLVSANFGHRIVGRDDEVRKRTLKNALHSSTRRAVAGIAMVVICTIVRGYTAIIYCALCRLRAGTPSVTCGDSSLHLREPRLVLI